jgi:hypothetical protein
MTLKEKIQTLHDVHKLSWREMSRVLKIPRSTLHRYGQQYGFTMRSRGGPNRVRKMISDGEVKRLREELSGLRAS